MNDQDEELWDTFGAPRLRKILRNKGTTWESLFTRWYVIDRFWFLSLRELRFRLRFNHYSLVKQRKSYNNSRSNIIPQNNVSIRTVGGHSHLFLCVTRYSADWPMKRDYIHRKLYRFSVCKLSFVVCYSLSLFFFLIFC